MWRLFEPVDLAEAAAALLGRPNVAPVTVVRYDEHWPQAFAELQALIVAALGPLALAVEHVGSTAVPGLAAKPVIDVDLTVPDSADESAYVPALEAAGFELRRREPEWEEHRLLTLRHPRANLHVWSPGALEPRRHQVFRDWLRSHDGDRQAYAALKADLGTRGFVDGNDYNNHKAEFVYDVYERIFAADPEHEHTPHPRP